MKKIFFSLIFSLSICANAQLRVTSGGNVVAGDAITYPKAQLTSFKEGTDTIIGLLGIAKSNNHTARPAGSPYMNLYMGTSFGVKGIAGGGSGPYNFGVCGLLRPHASGAAVAGFINETSFAPSADRYAGLFHGDVKVVGTLTATNVVSSSDMRLKKGVSGISQNVIDCLSSLNPIQYYWDPTQYAKCVYGYDAEMDDILDNKLHYGFIAQELREVFPDLVYGNEENGTLSINYVELIPLLVQSIQELSTEVQKLQGKETKRVPSLNTEFKYETPAALYQNSPNPFSQATIIKYQLPQIVQSAYIYVYDMSGNQVGSYRLADRGEGQLTISASEYHAGMFLYSLIADGQEIDTKRMILTK